MFVIGMDLSGPSNSKDTVLVGFKSSESGDLILQDSVTGADDNEILYFTRQLKGPMVVGLDAPLSYNVGGGDRPGDAELRRKIIAVGLKPGSVMAPTMTRMAYLTLRGISIARLLLAACEEPGIVEVHPGAAMALGGAPVNDVIEFKNNEESRWRLLEWLSRQGLRNVPDVENPSDHYVAACAAALAAWKWHQKRPAWIHHAEPPVHPFDYAC